MTNHFKTVKIHLSEQPSRRRTAKPPNWDGGGRRSPGAGTVFGVETSNDPKRDEEIREAIGMIQSGLEILLKRLGEGGAPIPLAALIESRAERFGGRLTDAELEVLTRYAEGETVDSIAESRRISKRTVHNQLGAATRKLGFADRRELTGYLKGAGEWRL